MLRFPLYKKKNGDIRSWLRLGADILSVVPDTGSAHLIVNEDEWQIRCGRDLLGEEKEIIYGGGKHIKYYEWSSCLGGEYPVIFGLKIDGSRIENVFGLQTRSRLLKSLKCPQLLYFDFPGDCYYIGHVPPLPPISASFDLYRYRPPDRDTEFLVGRVFKILVNGEPITAFPNSVVFDTGAAFATFPDYLFESFKDADVIEIVFIKSFGDRNSNSVIFELPLPMHADRVLFPDSCTLGSAWLERYGVVFDDEKQQIIFTQ